jgi:hypothetical protein
LARLARIDPELLYPVKHRMRRRKRAQSRVPVTALMAWPTFHG